MPIASSTNEVSIPNANRIAPMAGYNQRGTPGLPVGPKTIAKNTVKHSTHIVQAKHGKKTNKQKQKTNKKQQQHKITIT